MQLANRTTLNRVAAVPTRRVIKAFANRPLGDGPEPVGPAVNDAWKQNQDKSIINQGKPPSQADNPERVVPLNEMLNNPNAENPPKFEEVMAFDGQAPEIINGRLAMVGFTAAVAAELTTGASVLDQVTKTPLSIASTFVIIIAASLYPFLLGKKVSMVDQGPLTNFFNPTSEIWNCRAAMFGFAALLITEYFKGGALF